ncbi:unnamed protein product, partial [Ectocarpus sp. 13 AM-2016]
CLFQGSAVDEDHRSPSKRRGENGAPLARVSATEWLAEDGDASEPSPVLLPPTLGRRRFLAPLCPRSLSPSSVGFDASSSGFSSFSSRRLRFVILRWLPLVVAGAFRLNHA